MTNGSGRTPLVAGNWKMHTTLDEARALVEALLPGLSAVEGVERVLCPPFISLAAVAKLVRGSGIGVGAQTMYHADQGAFTGEISPVMLKPLVQWVIIGHSERRQLFGLTDTEVARTVAAARRHGLKPILCVGESLAQYDAGETDSFVAGQVRAALAGLDRAAGAGALGGLVIAYEPIWAIGTGKPSSPEGADRVAALIRRTVGELFGAEAAAATRVLYGGSVNAGNAAGFFATREIDGALVGGASLKADEFVQIARAAASRGG